MKNKLDIQWFIEQHSDWEKLLSEKPYCIQITRDRMFDRNLIMFKYNQIESDFHVGLVRECRGLILDEDTLEPVCVPFFKFGNYGESYCPEIDWSSCWVGEKLDGSLIKIVRLGENILVSTNGTIDAFKAGLAEQIGCACKSFGELVVQALLIQKFENMKHNHFGDKHNTARDWSMSSFTDKQREVEKEHVFKILHDMLEENKTYMFELTSPFNKVVVTWHETRLNFLGVRDNKTFQETYFSDHELKNYFNTPKVFPLGNIDECVKAAEALDFNNEGFVICDKNFNRVKVKSPLYVAIHHLRGENGVMSYRRALEIVKKNEVEEVLTYFPEYKSSFDDLTNRFNCKVNELESVWNRFLLVKNTLPTRKDQAIWITSNCKTSGLLFSMLDGKIQSIHDGLYNMPNENILKMLGYRD